MTEEELKQRYKVIEAKRINDDIVCVDLYHNEKKENMDCVKTENCLNQDCNYFSDEERIIAKSAFEEGAEFGYNKAMELCQQNNLLRSTL